MAQRSEVDSRCLRLKLILAPRLKAELAYGHKVQGGHQLGLVAMTCHKLTIVLSYSLFINFVLLS